MARLLDEFFALDLRSLALFRVGLATAILYDALDRSRDLIGHYTDLGAMPAATVLEVWGMEVYVSPFFWVSGSPFLVGLLFAALVLSALALALGWRTRIAAILCWLLLVTLQLRNPLTAVMGGDKFLRIILFWSLFLPLGARMSLDARRAATPSPYGDRWLSVAGAVLLLQVVVMYVATGLLKSGETWRNGTAVTYALHLDYFSTPIGVWLRDQTWLHPWLTHGTRWLEILGPFLAFMPFATGPLRFLTILIFASFHLSLAAGLWIGPFPLFCIVAWLAFVPSWFWDELLPRLGAGLRSRFPHNEGPSWPAPKWADIVTGSLFTYAVLIMLLLAYLDPKVPPPALRVPGKALRIEQSWGMFAPDPLEEEGWPVFRGILENGTQIDPMRGEPPFNAKPPLLSETFPSFRWRLFLFYLEIDTSDPNFELLFSGLGSHLCREWNQEHSGGEALREVGIEYWVESNRDLEAPARRYQVYRKRCPIRKA